MKHTKYLFLSMIAGLALTACDDDHKPDWPDQSPREVKCESASLENGAVTATNDVVVDFRYSTDIVINRAVAVTLNGTAIANQDKAVTVVDKSVLRVTLPELAAGTDYTLTIPERAVTGVGTMTFAPAVSINFTTGTTVLPEWQPAPLINANATAQTVNVYDFLAKEHGKKILSGAMANVNNNNDFAGWVKTMTGKDPAIICYDFIHLPQSGENWINYNDITPAETQWNANGLVGYMWHWNVPTDEQAWKDKDFNKYDAGSDKTNFDIERALQEGTWEHDFIMQDIAKVAEVLKKLQDKGIPVIWRPLHEAAGDYEYKNPWFWWGKKGGEATKELWKLLYDQLVNVHGCNNLIWVWTAQYKAGYETQMDADYPGNDYVDIVGTDIYLQDKTDDSSQVAAYNALVKMTEGKKLVAISETGRIQNPDKCFADKAYWSWFNLWYTYDIHKTDSTADEFGNTQASLQEVFGSPFVINRDQMPSLK